jgi:hypothetical protein
MRGINRIMLRRFPRLHNPIKKCYILYREIYFRLKIYLLGTRIEEKFWAKRHLYKGDDWGNKDNEWVDGYWDSRNHKHRGFLIDEILRFSPSAIAEIGSNCGPNLYLLAKKLPGAKIVGVDINPAAVREGNKRFTQEGMSNVSLYLGRADKLERFQDKSFDVVFTDAVLIYIGPDKIGRVIKEMLRIARKALILFEWHCFDSNPLGFYVGHWVRDYVALLKRFVPENKIRFIEMPDELWEDKNWQKYGGIIEVTIE